MKVNTFANFFYFFFFFSSYGNKDITSPWSPRTSFISPVQTVT